jgi:hypothetical protein
MPLVNVQNDLCWFCLYSIRHPGIAYGLLFVLCLYALGFFIVQNERICLREHSEAIESITFIHCTLKKPVAYSNLRLQCIEPHTTFCRLRCNELVCTLINKVIILQSL